MFRDGSLQFSPIPPDLEWFYPFLSQFPPLRRLSSPLSQSFTSEFFYPLLSQPFSFEMVLFIPLPFLHLWNGPVQSPPRFLFWDGPTALE
jgi:hypothetical protein